MAFFHRKREQRVGPGPDDLGEELSKIGPALGAAIDRFTHDVVKAASRTKTRHARVGKPPSRLPSTHAHRPVRRPLPQPGPLRSRAAKTVLDRHRALEARRRGDALPLGAAIDENAARVAAAIRVRLLALSRRVGLSGRPARTR